MALAARFCKQSQLRLSAAGRRSCVPRMASIFLPVDDLVRFHFSCVAIGLARLSGLSYQRLSPDLGPT
jgi:hypothetical protein